MKKGQYNICIQYKGKPHKVTVSGYLYEDNESKIKFGYRYNKGRYDITELSTGLLITDSAETHTVKRKDEVISYITKHIDIIKKLLDSKSIIKHAFIYDTMRVENYDGEKVY